MSNSRHGGVHLQFQGWRGETGGSQELTVQISAQIKKIKLSEDLVTPKRWGIIEEDTRRQSLAFKRGHAAHILHTNGYTYIHDIHI